MEANEAKASARETQKLLVKAKEEILSMEKEHREHEVEKKNWREKYHLIKSSLEDKVYASCCLYVIALAFRLLYF